MAETKYTLKTLKRLGITMDDIGLIELNEAFTAQSLGVMHKLTIDHEITNLNCSAIALEHLTTYSGARILTTLLVKMKRRARHEMRSYYGLATLCLGLDMGSFDSC